MFMLMRHVIARPSAPQASLRNMRAAIPAVIVSARGITSHTAQADIERTLRDLQVRCDTMEQMVAAQKTALHALQHNTSSSIAYVPQVDAAAPVVGALYSNYTAMEIVTGIAGGLTIAVAGSVVLSLIIMVLGNALYKVNIWMQV